MYNLSSAEGPRFAEIAREMTERVRALGPNPLGLRTAAREVSRVPGVTGEQEP
jgi:F420-non-reducing hydrogenase iron-sulfur subunit